MSEQISCVTINESKTGILDLESKLSFSNRDIKILLEWFDTISEDAPYVLEDIDYILGNKISH